MKKTITLIGLMLIVSMCFAQEKKADSTSGKTAPVMTTPPPPAKKMYFFAFDEDFVAGIYKIIMSSNEPFASVVNPVKQMFEYQVMHQPTTMVQDTVQKKK